MDIGVMQNVGADGVKKRKKRRKKKMTTEINKVETGEASDGLRDCDVASYNLETDLIKADLMVKLLSENSNMDADSVENLSKGNASTRRKKGAKRNKKGKINIEAQNMGLGEIDAGFRNLTGEIEIQCRISETAGSEVHVRSMDQTEMDVGSTENLIDGNVPGKNKKKRKKKRKKKSLCETVIEKEVQSIDWNKVEVTSTANINEGNVTGGGEGDNDYIKKLIIEEVESTDKHKMVLEVTENPAVGNVAGKRKRKKKMERKNLCETEIKNEVQIRDQTKADVMPTENINEETVIGKGRRENESVMKSTIEEVQSMDECKMVTEVTGDFTEGDATGKRKRKKERKVKIKHKAASVNLIKMDEGLMEDLEEGIETVKKRRTRRKKTKVEVQSMNQVDKSLIENLTEGNATGGINTKISTKATIDDEVKGIDQNELGTGSVETLAINKISNRRKKRKFKKKAQSMDEHGPKSNVHLLDENQYICDPNTPGQCNGVFETGLIKASDEIILDEEKDSAMGTSVFSTRNVKAAEYLYPKSALVPSSRRKLLVLDINGLLADVVKSQRHLRGDIRISGSAIFKRPFFDDFLKFCFWNFDVGIWSSRSWRMISKIVEYLLGDLQKKLLFCWDMSHCTQTGFRTLENCHKPLVCKELRKIWESDGPNSRWKKGDFDESNTLLVDDSPYKALLNPLHTGIFPSPYHYVNQNDNALGPEGDLRVYLEELVKSENVQKHVEQHPFGRKAIDGQNHSWGFYAGVLNRMSARARLEN